jgi:copper chaperone CopZ
MDQSGALQALEIPVSGMHCDRCLQRVRAALVEVPGIERSDVTLGSVILEFYPEAMSADAVRAKIEALGYSVPVATRSRNPVRRFLDRLTIANEKAFGNEPLDCCTMKKYVK